LFQFTVGVTDFTEAPRSLERLASLGEETAQAPWLTRSQRATRRCACCTGRRRLALGAAYLHAFAEALAEGWDRIVQMDADFSHNPADVPRLLQALDDGADMAVGSRYVAGGGTENWGLGRRIISRGGGLYARMALGVGVHDLTAGFKAWKAATLHGINLGAVSARGYGFQIEMTYRTLRAGFQVRKVPILFVDRRVGLSKMSGSIFFEALTLVWRLRLRVARGKAH
jgi:dolichol-phosphate mannosyltransferase